MIRVEELRKGYGELVAVGGISFEVEAGEIYGLLGPNGAGKTTTLSMIAGLLAPDGGRVVVDGIDLAAEPLAVKERLGVVPQETAVYEELTARENLRFWGGLYGLGGAGLREAVEEALERVGLLERSREPVERFSGGMKRRLNLALGLLHRPRALLLDEPTVGIDVQARERILDVVREVAGSGTAVLYTTHYLEEAEGLCDRVGILDHGEILAEGTVPELERQVGEREVVTVQGAFVAEDVLSRLEGLVDAEVLNAEPGRVVLAAGVAGSGSVELLARLFGGELELSEVSIEPPSLAGLFLKLTGRELRD